MCSRDSHKVWISSQDEESHDWSWVHSFNFSSITLAVLGIGHCEENVISDSTDVTDGWVSLISPQIKNHANNFMVTSVNHLFLCEQTFLSRVNCTPKPQLHILSTFSVFLPTFASVAYTVCPVAALKSTRIVWPIIT